MILDRRAILKAGVSASALSILSSEAESGVILFGRMVVPASRNLFAIGAPFTWPGTSANWSLSSGGAGGQAVPTSIDNVTIDSNTGGTVTATSTVNVKSITHSAGTLDLTNQIVNVQTFTRVSGVNTIIINGTTLNVSSTVTGTALNLPSGGTAVLTSNSSSVINLTGGAPNVAFTVTFSMGNYNGALNFTGPSGTGLPGLWTFAPGSSTTFKSISYLNSTSTDFLALSQVFTIQASGALSLNGAAANNRPLFKGATLGTARTVTVPNTATVTVANIDLQDITTAGTFGTWSGTLLGNCGGNTGVTFTTAAPQTFAGGTKNASDASAWTSRVPLPQDNVTVAASGNLTFDMPRVGASLDFTGFTGTANFPIACSIFGSLTLASGATYIGNTTAIGGVALTLAGRGSFSITTNGVQFPNNMTFAAVGGTYTLQDDLALQEVGGSNSAGLMAVLNGTLAMGSHNISCWNFVGSGSATRAITGSGNISIADNFQDNAAYWNVSATLNITSWTGMVIFTGNIGASVAQTGIFAGAGLTYLGGLRWTANGSTGTLKITGPNVFATLQVDPDQARTLTLTHGITQTITTTLSLNGQAGKLLTVNSDLAGTQATISSSLAITTDYLFIKDINFTGTGSWHAGANSVNGGNNSASILFP